MDKDDVWGEREGRPTPEDLKHAAQVRAALHRVNAPDGFTERLMARPDLRGHVGSVVRAGAGANRGVLLQFTRPAWRFAYAAAAVLLVAAGTVHVERTRTEQRRADVAAAQFDTALQVTNHALDHVSAKLQSTEFRQVERALEADGGGKE